LTEFSTGNGLWLPQYDSSNTTFADPGGPFTSPEKVQGLARAGGETFFAAGGNKDCPNGSTSMFLRKGYDGDKNTQWKWGWPRQMDTMPYVILRSLTGLGSLAWNAA